MWLCSHNLIYDVISSMANLKSHKYKREIWKSDKMIKFVDFVKKNGI